ncbi:hypothetical protein BN1232_01458 [Mycobacterium lentiflavum]|uniref:Uncharacterized protein n=1 Tax=Mycobacterium lentiflavum TaxID=141349 RepID=A0A0E4CM75_MYCLN|nr:hypothetical protein BN1232_01458 [Mycobacterium lentiflavum]
MIHRSAKSPINWRPRLLTCAEQYPRGVLGLSKVAAGGGGAAHIDSNIGAGRCPKLRLG